MILATIILRTQRGWRAQSHWADGRMVLIVAGTREGVLRGLEEAQRDMSEPHEKVCFHGECQ